MNTAKKILDEYNLKIGTAKRAKIRLAYKLANDEGAIQAHDMRTLTNDPQKHCATNMIDAFIMLGAKN